jgi:hypothetical protein
MTLAFVGGTHRTVPLPLRERLAFSAEQAADALRRFRDRFPGREGVLLSTCNRVELYAAGESDAAPPAREQLVSFLAECRGIDAGLLVPVLAGESDEAVVRHLFSVASGLDSMVLGEPQIVAQVKQAWAIAQESRTTGPLTGEMFQAALRTAKRVATETALGRERLSIPSIAVTEFVSGVFERFDDKRVLLIGAGKMARETLRYVREAGARDVAIVNRTADRARGLAAELQARAASFAALADELTAADLVVSTAAGDPRPGHPPGFRSTDRCGARRVAVFHRRPGESLRGQPQEPAAGDAGSGVDRRGRDAAVHGRAPPPLIGARDRAVAGRLDRDRRRGTGASFPPAPRARRRSPRRDPAGLRAVCGENAPLAAHVAPR